MTENLTSEPTRSPALEDAPILARADAPEPVRFAAPGAGTTRSGRRLPWVPVVILTLIGVSAVFAPVLAPYDPLDASLVNALRAPGAGHLLGTDSLGRDYLSRLLFGARISLIVVVAGMLGASLIGLSVGI